MQRVSERHDLDVVALLVHGVHEPPAKGGDVQVCQTLECGFLEGEGEYNYKGELLLVCPCACKGLSESYPDCTATMAISRHLPSHARHPPFQTAPHHDKGGEKVFSPPDLATCNHSHQEHDVVANVLCSIGQQCSVSQLIGVHTRT